MRLLHKLILGYATAGLLILVVGYVSARVAETSLEKQIAEQSQDVADRLVRQIDMHVQDRVQAFRAYCRTTRLREALAQSNDEFAALDDMDRYIDGIDSEWTLAAREVITPDMQRLIGCGLSEEFRDIMAFYARQGGQRVIGEMFVTNRHGANAAQSGKTTDYRQDDEGWWQAAREAGVYVGDVQYDGSADVYSIEVAVAVQDREGEFLGVLKVVLSIDEIIGVLRGAYIADIAEEHRPEAYSLLTGDGRLVYSTRPFELFEDVSALLPPRLTNQHVRARPGTFVREDEEGREVVCSYASSPGRTTGVGPGWTVLTEHSRDRLYAPIRRLRRGIHVVALLVTGLGLAIGLFVSRSVSRRIARLEEGAHIIGKGDFDYEVATGARDEIGRLSRAFQQMAANLKAITASRDDLDREVAERERAAARLSESEERFRALVANIPGAVYRCACDEHWTMEFISERIRDISGYPASDFLGNQVRSYASIIHPDDASRVEDEALQAVERREPYEIEYRIVDSSGAVRWLYEKGQGIFGEDGELKYLDGAIFDVSERRKAQEASRRSEQRLRLLAETAFDGVNITESNPRTGKERLIFCNDRYVEMSGRTREELESAEDLGQFREVRMTGDEVARFRRRLQEGLPTRGIASWRRPDGRENVYEWSSVRVESGGRLFTFGVDRDITEQKAAERELQRALAELERSNAELEQFAYVASHDLQEPLRKIRAFGDRLRSKCADLLTDKGIDYLDRMQNAAARMSTLIENLLSLSRVTTKGQPLVRVDMNQVAEDVVSDLEAQVQRAGGQVQVGDLPTIDADPTQMRQLLQNLIGNALKFHRDGVPPVVEVAGEVCPNQDGQESCRLTVGDNGIGFEQRHLERVFGVFQRLHPRDEYGGTGIGLAICRKIVQRHRGEITARSNPGEGSTFIVTLPVTQAEEGTE